MQLGRLGPAREREQEGSERSDHRTRAHEELLRPLQRASGPVYPRAKTIGLWEGSRRRVFARAAGRRAMSGIVEPGAGVLFMMVGTHARESLDDIIARKAKEIEDAGFAMWGYGGNTCHPRTMVQPFAESFKDRGKPIYLCMNAMPSSHIADPVRAQEYSVDGIKWL